MKYHRDIVTEPAVTELSFVGGAMPGVIDEVLLRRIAFHRLNGADDQVATNFYIRKLVPPRRERPVQQDRHAERTGVVHPVAAFYAGNGLLRCPQLVMILVGIILGHGFLLKSSTRWLHFFIHDTLTSRV